MLCEGESSVAFMISVGGIKERKGRFGGRT